MLFLSFAWVSDYGGGVHSVPAVHPSEGTLYKGLVAAGGLWPPGQTIWVWVIFALHPSLLPKIQSSPMWSHIPSSCKERALDFTEVENALSLGVKSVPPVASQLHPGHSLRFACPCVHSVSPLCGTLPNLAWTLKSGNTGLKAWLCGHLVIKCNTIKK